MRNNYKIIKDGVDITNTYSDKELDIITTIWSMEAEPVIEHNTFGPEMKKNVIKAFSVDINNVKEIPWYVAYIILATEMIIGDTPEEHWDNCVRFFVAIIQRIKDDKLRNMADSLFDVLLTMIDDHVDLNGFDYVTSISDYFNKYDLK